MASTRTTDRVDAIDSANDAVCLGKAPHAHTTIALFVGLILGVTAASGTFGSLVIVVLFGTTSSGVHRQNFFLGNGSEWYRSIGGIGRT